MSRNWMPVMNKLKGDIHKDITASLDVIKTDFESKGLPFDEKFRNLFCRSISNRYFHQYQLIVTFTLYLPFLYVLG